MTINVKILRSTSVGIQGTYRNAEHHAKPCIPFIKIIESSINGLGQNYDFTWIQGNNLHVIQCGDRKITMRPFSNKEIGWGIDILVKASRENEIPIMSITNVAEAGLFVAMLELFLYRGTTDNHYGSKEHANNSRAK